MRVYLSKNVKRKWTLRLSSSRMGKKINKFYYKDNSNKDGEYVPHHFKRRYSHLFKKFSSHLVRFKGNKILKFFILDHFS